ncbi:hypothetical protein MXM41_22250 [Leclercia adecarboxylata]|uniref:hypothetical protein n=1 Tax=Leclercia adecarboxylata TaxID=83655 RepID=UPI002DBC6A2A|nr:hypothetical protein [Leclercia adecarboxylata]MEB6381620.1 hypothetical protein [Leclercia adecarboxylata]
MSNIFLHISNIQPEVNSPADLSSVISKNANKVFSISLAVVDWLLGTIDFSGGEPLPKLKNCCFAFANCSKFIEFDSKGRLVAVKQKPSWYPDLNLFLRDQWLRNYQMYDLPLVKFIKLFLKTFTCIHDRRIHCNLLFDLQLDKIKQPSVPYATQPASKLGNKNRKSTSPKVGDLKSFDLFTQFLERLTATVEANEFPRMQVLTGYENLAKAPKSLKGAVRTWYKAVTGDLPPNNKKVASGNASIYCASIRTAISQVTNYNGGLQVFYNELSQAIFKAGDLEVSRFNFKPIS